MPLINKWLEDHHYAQYFVRDLKVEQLILTAINTLGASQSPLAIKPLKYFADHGSTNVREAAYETLIELDLYNRSAYAIAALNDPSYKVRATIIEKLGKRDASGIPSTLLFDNLTHPLTKLPTIKLLGYYSNDKNCLAIIPFSNLS